jgi:alpha-galactosidase
MSQISRRDMSRILLSGCAGALLDSRHANASPLSSPMPPEDPGREGSPVSPAGSRPQLKDSNGTGLTARQPSASGESLWSDVLLVDGPEPIISYRTGWVVYEESLTNGQLVGRGWNGAGYINFYDGRLDPAEHRMPEAFRLEIDGQALIGDWKWGGLQKQSPAEGETLVTITLTHSVRPVMVKVHTKLDGTAILTRWLEVTNTSSKPSALATVSSWSGVLRKNEHWRSHLGDTKMPLYSLGYFEGTTWGEEGDFQWHDMPPAGYRVDGRYRRDRYRHPIFMLRNNATGEFFIGELAWTGGYSFEFDLNPEAGANESAAMTFAAGPDAPAPMRIIAAGEAVSTPEMHLGLVFGDLDAAVQAMHDHLRKSVFPPPARGQRGWIESGIGPELEITPEQLTHSIDVAIEIGAEVFFIDASWYAPPGANWWKTVGDWDVDKQRFPEGLKPFRDRVHSAGMLWGLWMDAERLGAGSRAAKEHPDWLAMSYSGKREMSGLLDLTNPEAAKWMEEQIVRVIEENQLDFFRLDYNTDYDRGIKRLTEGYVENGYWRYYETLYGIYQRLRDRFPKVIFENCAGGGGRTDIGMVRWFNHTDITDWQIAPRSFTITNGMTMALPPEYVDRLLGGQDGQTAAEFDFQSRLLLFLEPKFGFLYPPGAPPNPIFTQRAKHWVGLYKNFVRPFINTSRIYHHTPEMRGHDPHGWGVLELTSRDRARAICGLFQLSAPTDPDYVLHPRGLDVSRRYKVTFDNLGQSTIIDGYTLTQQGVRVQLATALTSELLTFEAV